MQAVRLRVLPTRSLTRVIAATPKRNTMKLSNKSALVTGASRGIGRAIAIKLASQGARVAVNYRSGQTEADAVVSQILESGGNAFAVQGDVAKLDDINRVFDEIDEHFGPLDILVNNAGIGEFVPFLEATPEHFDKQFALNVRGLFFVTQRAAQTMRDGGRIINISSIAAQGLSAEGAAYGATKGAVNAFTAGLSKGLAARHITVNSISPGLVETDLVKGSFSDEDIERTVKSIALGRAGQPEDIADIAAFLASDDARWITGRELIADGGTL